MIRLRHKLFVELIRLLDPIVLFGSLLLSASLFEPGTLWRASELLHGTITAREGIGIAILAAGWWFIFYSLVHYDTDRFTSLRTEVLNLGKATSAAAFLLLLVSATFSFERLHSQTIVVFWLTCSGLTIALRMAIRGFLMAVRRSGFNYRHVVIVGNNQHARDLAARIERLPELGYKIRGFVSELVPGEPTQCPSSASTPQILGDTGEMKEILERNTVDELIVCLPVREHAGAIFDVVQLAEELGVVVRLFPDAASRRIVAKLNLERFDRDVVVTLFREQLLLQLLAKRALDVTVSALLLLVLSPLLVAVATAIKLTSRGPVLFVQRRVGMNKRPFDLYKFRSMYLDADARRAELAHLNEMDGPVFKIHNDPRVTSVGHFIRRMSIDELPQLWNVLRGHMSLVGPRPPLPEEGERYEWLYRKRLSIKPGITCLWQVSGRNRLSFKQWMELDRRYIDNWSLWLDMKILARTIPAVLLSRGAS
jgi:exopolysaccharide biosynthesis polyprenyl glycosylphosphotransferase